MKNIEKLKSSFFKNERGLFSLYLIIIIFLIYKTGIVSDGYCIVLMENKFPSFFDTLINGQKHLARPGFRYLYSIFYYFVDINQLILIEFLKILQAVVVFYMVMKFFSIFINKSSSMLVAFLFIFYPTHDSTTYSHVYSHYAFCIGLYLYSYYLVSNGRFISAGISSTLASFVFYGSPPIAIALFTLCLLKKSYKQGLIIFVPNIVYCGYFLFITKILNEDVQRISSELNFLSLLKQYLLQVFGFFDAVGGPSFYLKIYYAILQNKSTSIVLAIIFISGFVLILRTQKEKKDQVDKGLLIILIILTLGSFGIFAMTGGYPQLAFTLGNRTTIYGSLLVAYLLVTLPMANVSRNIIIITLFASIVGMSSHWKQWNQSQKEIINNIKSNKILTSYKSEETVYVIGNHYSKMGPYSNVEFFSEDWVISCVFELALNKKLKVKSLSNRLEWVNGALKDKKYNTAIPTTRNFINVYDSEKNKLIKIPTKNINNYIDNLPKEKRHWIQMINSPQINALVQKLMPRLAYIF